MIRKKFECCNQNWNTFLSHPSAVWADVVEGYLSVDPERTVYVKIESYQGKDTQATLTIKGKNDQEFSYLIPIKEARLMLNMSYGDPLVYKLYAIRTQDNSRYTGINPFSQPKEQTWYLRIYDGANAGLVINEVELVTEGEELLAPDWVGNEITDSRYAHEALVLQPYKAPGGSRLIHAASSAGVNLSSRG